MSEIESSKSIGRFQFSFVGNGNDLALLMLENLFLTIITLGFYRPWAKTNMRRYLWENVQFMGDRASYVGTGKELFSGWMKLFGILFLLFILVTIIEKFIPILRLPLTFVTPFVYVYIFALATYSGLRYRLSRTLWRQTRFGVDKDRPSTQAFLKLYITGIFLTAITLGIYYPFFKNQIRHFLVNRSRLGTAYFKYDGADRDFAKIYFLGLTLSIITLGIYIPWFLANLTRFRLKHSQFQNARFDFKMEGKELLICGLGLYFGTLLTFGLAIPWIYTWVLRRVSRNIFLEGELDFSTITQRASDGSALAEDFVTEYDIDLGIL